MNIISNFVLKIKRKENPFFAFIYRSLKWVYFFNIPSIRFIHLPLYHLDFFFKTFFRRLLSKLWSEPLFKARCLKVGKNLNLPDGIPLILGSQLRMTLGDNVTLGRSTISTSKVFDEANLIIGSNTTINYGAIISVTQSVTIGDNTLVGVHCMIMDSNDHPISPEKRLQNLPVDPEDVKPVIIGNNVWIGSFSAVLKGVVIGDNAIIGANSVVTKNIPQNSIAVGSPAKVVVQKI